MSGFPEVNGTQVIRLPPDGYVVDFDNPQQQKVLEHYLIFGIFGPLAFIALMQRYYTKIFLSKGLSVDDAFMFLAWLASVTMQSLLTGAIAMGTMCAHTWEIPLPKFLKYSMMSYFGAAIFMLCNGFTKLSLLTFYLHLSPQRWWKTAVWTSIGIVSLYTAVITLMLFFHCTPVPKAFDVTITDGSCIDVAILFIATAVSNIVTDVMLFILPIPMVVKLRMGVGQKVGAIIVFGIGSVTVMTSVIRLVYLFPVLASQDITWDAAPANIWSFLEANLFIICGSMPTLRKFFKHFAPRVFGGGSSSNPSYPSYGPAYAMGRSGVAESRARKQRKHYEQFPEANEMATFNSGSGSQENITKEAAATSVTVDANTTEERAETDAHSDKAILQTKSFTVRYD